MESNFLPSRPHSSADLSFGSPVPPDAFAQLRRRMIFDECKWDPQTHDQSTLFDRPLILSGEAAHYLATEAQALARETLLIELELADRPELHRALGLPWRVRRLMARSTRPRTLTRIQRFDFHLTTQGWRISEVNSDVPGGWIEAGAFTRRMGAHYPHLRVPPDPAQALVKACTERLADDNAVALVHATAYTDDRQVMASIAPLLQRAGLRTYLVAPDQLQWKDDRARIVTEWHNGPADGIIRFFPAEWLVNLPRKARWRGSATGSGTPQCNPVSALLTQSKRLPLFFDRLRTETPTWERLLPETRHPVRAFLDHPDWILKPALGRVGDGIAMTGITEARVIKLARRSARWWPRHWVAQRRFESVPLQAGDQMLHACLGVYTVGQKFAGIYGRVSRKPLIDEHAQDVAVLIQPD